MKVNNRVRWHSAMGVLEGTIIGDMIHTLNPDRFAKDRTTCLPETMLAALKLEVI